MNNQNNNYIVPINLKQLEKETMRRKNIADKNLPQSEKNYLKNEKNNVKIGINHSPQELYLPLPKNDDIVLIRQNEQKDWDAHEADRSKMQREFFSNMSGLQGAVNEKKFLEHEIYKPNKNVQEIREKIHNLEASIEQYKNNINKFIDLTSYAPLRSVVSEKVCFKSLEKRDFPWPVFFNQSVGKDKETNKFIADIATNMLPEALLNLYTYDDFKNTYLTLPPNMSLFWYNCDLSQTDLNQAFWQNQGNDQLQRLMNNKKHILYGRDATKLLARSLHIQAVREIFDSIDGEPNRAAWAIASWIFAREASGTVFVACDKPKEEYFSHWRLIEHPTLLNNKKVDMIVRLDIKDPSKIDSIEFPNGLFADNLSKCTFEISKASIDALVAQNGNNDNAELWAEYCENNEFEKITYNNLFNIELSELVNENQALKLDYASGNVTVFNKNTEIKVDLRENADQKSKIIKDIVKDKNLLHLVSHDIPTLNVIYPVRNRQRNQPNQRQNQQQPNPQIQDGRRM